MYHFSVERDPLRIKADGTTRAGLIVAGMQGYFAALGIEPPLEGQDMNRPFELEAANAVELILAVLRAASGTASSNKEMYTDISFSLITDKKATGHFVGRAVPSLPALPPIHGIDGEVLKDADGLWRATIALG
jgi:hypothetical protein